MSQESDIRELYRAGEPLRLGHAAFVLACEKAETFLSRDDRGSVTWEPPGPSMALFSTIQEAHHNRHMYGGQVLPCRTEVAIFRPGAIEPALAAELGGYAEARARAHG